MASDTTPPPVGITGCGAWIPRRRIARKTIAGAHAWFNPALSGGARGRRAQAGWDEDSVTMAVAAVRGALGGADPARVSALWLASTTLPFADRQNATLVAEACGVPGPVRTLDLAGSLRAGTGALLAGLLDGGLPAGATAVVAAADTRRAKPASADELAFGHAAAAVTLGREGVIARLLAWRSESEDLVDHYRAAGSDHDYRWEERWARDEGVVRQAPPVVRVLLESAGVAAAEVARVIVPAASAGDAQRIAKACGLAPDRVVDTLADGCGHAGAAHPLLLLARCLEDAEPGERILVTGFGQGFDALLFEVTDAIRDRRPAATISEALAGGWEDDNYLRFLAFEGNVELETGIRAEADLKTAHSVAYRSHAAVTGLHAGRCTACGTVQFPPERVCVNRDCGAIDRMEPYRLADRPARVVSFTRDALAYHPDPPVEYGMVEFEGGGRLLAEFTEWERVPLAVGAEARLVFRIKDQDRIRGFRRYFWKAVPATRGE
ncbi:3-hydroxy-3-methylglutaryl CoA synthase [Azospirillum sp. RWY-5-1]|uniref:3-hydroxy-3-methylglutaryl CoA synthase n=1 Tax=Azospirillum oleiclasticum TaxID=2735135 RepID=A0ABX2TIA9_9PROT|nr:3-oxoacyl-[acyl-carrier-protein] synthase III C-terminal domain-containing protein [Azospirillum oleiclasticum]NYZ16562.1 3-hydroxy-3-methylglutaryl CoA synthase [Azospirillum oleiclasticum]NYZ23968.1 3-hydroxy-3-methylglutaryl CoA synthase [Azospirillum oleiclasticum]